MSEQSNKVSKILYMCLDIQVHLQFVKDSVNSLVNVEKVGTTTPTTSSQDLSNNANTQQQKLHPFPPCDL